MDSRLSRPLPPPHWKPPRPQPREPPTGWRPMGGPCASRIDFPGAEFIPEAAAASGDRGARESGAELERGLCRANPKRAPATPHLPRPRGANPGICIPRAGLRGWSTFLPSPAHAGTKDRVLGASPRGSGDLGGRMGPARRDTVAPASPPPGAG